IGTGNRIQRNSIPDPTGVSGLGIDLGADGVTLNDPGDTDSGANNLQNFPELKAALALLTKTRVSGKLKTQLANSTYTLDFYASPKADPSGYGEGQRWLGSATVVTDSLGNATFTVDLPGLTFPPDVVTATATDPAGNTS